MKGRALYVILPGFHMVEAGPGTDTSNAISHAYVGDEAWTPGPPAQGRPGPRRRGAATDDGAGLFGGGDQHDDGEAA